jgi:hypothetical protein
MTAGNAMPMSASESHGVVIGLHAAIVAVIDFQPHVLVVRRAYAPLESGAAAAHHFESAGGTEFGLPFGPFDPSLHRTLEIGLRSWVEDQTSLRLGYAEQLYTFGDRDRYVGAPGESARVVSVGYLALTRAEANPPSTDSLWHDWYRHFPWEDWRGGQPRVIDDAIGPKLDTWAKKAGSPGQIARRRDRISLCFGGDGIPWDEEKVLDRYELLYEAGLVAEAERDRRLQQGKAPGKLPTSSTMGAPMQFDHRRILATAMGRLRGKLKYRPVVFELMPESFTLLELQRTVEAITGVELHKQNFRRLVEREGLVEPTGEQSSRAGGRPAALFHFRREVWKERPAPGVRVRGRG